MKRELFFLLLVILLLILWNQSQAVEAFQNKAQGPEPALNIPATTPGPAPIGDKGPQPFAPPSNALLAPPPGQTASVNSYPFDDPAMKKAPLKQLKNAMETLKGFLTNEAPSLKNSSDPATQLPMQTAESDLRRLQDEMAVMSRNPGIESSLTIGDLNGINANLAFLQKKWRLSANSIDSVEGFQSGSPGGSPAIGSPGGSPAIGSPGGLGNLLNPNNTPPGFNNLLTNPCGSGQVYSASAGSGGACVTVGAACGNGSGTYDATGACVSPYNGSPPGGSPPGGSPPGGSPPGGSPPGGSLPSGSSGSGSSGSGSSGSSGSSNTGNISAAQLVDLKIKISAFITQLKNSGATNAVITQRINTLTYLLQQIMDYETKVETGQMKESDIPIKFSDYRSFLPYININDPGQHRDDPLPQLLSATGASGALANLFPYYFGGDISGAQLAQELFKKYAQNLFSDVGYSVNVNLTKKSASETQVTQEIANALANGTLGRNTDIAFSDTDNDGNTYGAAPTSITGMFNSIIQAISGKGATAAPETSSTTPTTTGSQPNLPSHFNWEDRANQICEQITKRGLNGYDYGCLDDPSDVSENFSYRGYARMVCSRLETNYDPSIPGLCGCPPPTWPGWRP